MCKTRQDKTRQDPVTDEFMGLRSRAEAAIQEKAIDSPDVSTLPTQELQALVHELRVHQIELEMQNDELKRVQLAWEEARDKYQELYDSVPVGHFTLTHKGIIKEVNRTGAILLGMSRSKLINMRFGHFVVSESDDQWYQHIISALGHEEKQSCVLTLQREDGSSFYARLESVQQVAPVELRNGNGGTLVVNMAVTDITERKVIEEALKKSEERWQFALEGSRDGVWDWNAQTNEVFFSCQWKAMLGYEEHEIGNTLDEWDKRVHPDDKEQCYLALNRHLSGEAPFYENEHRVLCKDGTYKWILDRGKIRERTEDGKPLRVIGTHSDMTERKRLEEERIEMQHKLHLAQKFQSLGVMAGGIAHDFNNLLMAILGNLEFALTDRGLGAEGKKAIAHAIEATDRSAELSHQMLIYSGKLFYVPKVLDLCELAHKNEDLLKLYMPKTTTLHFQIHKGHLAIRGDEDQIQRVITNLVRNASEAIGENTGDVTLATGAMDCDAAYLSRCRLEEKPEPGEFVFVQVTDTGCGMDAETQHKLFDPFFTTKFWGRGLGMAEVMGIVKGHHGNMMVESEIGKGTTIRVLFPVSKKPQALPVQVNDFIETKAPASESVSRRKTVLVVDDEELVRGLVLKRLEVLGYDTIAAVDGEEGVHLFSERLNEIDLVLLDFAMPKMNGVEAFGELIRIRPDVKAILSSGYTEDVVAKSFPGPKPAGFLSKPYKMEELKGELERLLGTRDGLEYI